MTPYGGPEMRKAWRAKETLTVRIKLINTDCINR